MTTITKREQLEQIIKDSNYTISEIQTLKTLLLPILAVVRTGETQEERVKITDMLLVSSGGNERNPDDSFSLKQMRIDAGIKANKYFRDIIELLTSTDGSESEETLSEMNVLYSTVDGEAIHILYEHLQFIKGQDYNSLPLSDQRFLMHNEAACSRITEALNEVDSVDTENLSEEFVKAYDMVIVASWLQHGDIN